MKKYNSETSRESSESNFLKRSNTDEMLAEIQKEIDEKKLIVIPKPKTYT